MAYFCSLHFWKYSVLLLLHTPLNTFCGGHWIRLWKSEKRNHQMQRAAFCTKHGNKLTSPKHKLHTFQVKTSTVQDKDLIGNRCHFRHLQHFCSSRAAILLTFLEDNAQNFSLFFFQHSWNTIVLFSHSKNHGLRSNQRGEQKICGLFAGRGASTV